MLRSRACLRSMCCPAQCLLVRSCLVHCMPGFCSNKPSMQLNKQVAAGAGCAGAVVCADDEECAGKATREAHAATAAHFIWTQVPFPPSGQAWPSHSGSCVTASMSNQSCPGPAWSDCRAKRPALVCCVSSQCVRAVPWASRAHPRTLRVFACAWTHVARQLDACRPHSGACAHGGMAAMFRPRHEPALLAAQLRDVAQAVDSRGTFRRATAAAALATANAALDGSARSGPAGTGGAGEGVSRAGTAAAAEVATCADRAGMDGNGFAAPVPSSAASSISGAAELALPGGAHAMLAAGSAAQPSVASGGDACASARVVGGVAAAPELAMGAEPAGGATQAPQASGRAQQPPNVMLSGGEARAPVGNAPGSEDEGELLPERADGRPLPGSGPGGQAPGMVGGQPPPGAGTTTAEPPSGDAAMSLASRIEGAAAAPAQPPGRPPLPASEEEAAVRIAAALKATDARLGRLHAALPPNALLLVLGCQGDTLEVRRLQVSPGQLCNYLAECRQCDVLALGCLDDRGAPGRAQGPLVILHVCTACFLRSLPFTRCTGKKLWCQCPAPSPSAST
jgi:hypothetical protein